MFGLLLASALQAAPPSEATPVAKPAAIAEDFKVGVDTLSTVVARLGKPMTVTHASDGTAIAIYVTNHTHLKGTTFIPIVGLFAGGAKGGMSTKSFTFGSDGFLKSYSSSETNVNCSTSIAAASCR